MFEFTDFTHQPYTRIETNLNQFYWRKNKMSMEDLLLAHPQFFSFVEKEASRKVIDTEGRVSEPLKCGYDWMLWGTFAGIPNQG